MLLRVLVSLACMRAVCCVLDANCTALLFVKWPLVPQKTLGSGLGMTLRTTRPWGGYYSNLSVGKRSRWISVI